MTWRPLTLELLERACLATRTHHWLPLVRAWKAGALRTVIVVGHGFFPPARIYDPP